MYCETQCLKIIFAFCFTLKCKYETFASLFMLKQTGSYYLQVYLKLSEAFPGKCFSKKLLCKYAAYL